MSSIHNILGSHAVSELSEKERIWWGNEINDLPELCFLPDRHLEHQNDAEKEKEMRKYCLLDDGSPIPHTPTDNYGNWCLFSGSGLEDIMAERVVPYYIKKILDSARQKNMHSTACFTGALSHYVQDNAIPVHVINNMLMNHLFPEKNNRYIHYHYIIDGLPFDIEKIALTPCILGTSAEELAFNLIQKIKQNREKALSVLVPLIYAIDNEDIAEQYRISNIYNGNAIELTISLWHTIYALANNDFSEYSDENLKKFRLSRTVPVYKIEPVFDREKFRSFGIEFYPTLYSQCDPERSYVGVAPYRFEPALNLVYGKNGQILPIQLQNGNNIDEYQDCIAMSGYGLSVFDTPGDLYGTLEVTAGFHPASNSGKTLRFSIMFDCTSGLKLAFQQDKKEGENSSQVKISLPHDCKRTFFIVNGGTPATSALWCDPVIIKK